jgi:hypothetical protein
MIVREKNFGTCNITICTVYSMHVKVLCESINYFCYFFFLQLSGRLTRLDLPEDDISGKVLLRTYLRCWNIERFLNYS